MHQAYRWILAAACASAVTLVQAAYPERPITLVVPFSAGGGADALARVLAKNLSPHLNGQSLIVENKPGASGNIGAKLVERAPNDGYTFLLTNSTLVINAALNMAGTPDIKNKLVPVSLIASSPVAIGVNQAAVPTEDLKSFVSYLKRNANASYSSCGGGTPQNFAGEMVNQALSIKLVHIPYKGCAPAIADGLANQVPILFSTVPNLAMHSQAGGKLKIVGVTSKNRPSFLQDVPSLSEQPELRHLDVSVWFGLFSAPGIPAPVMQTFQHALDKTLKDPAVRHTLTEMYYEIEPTGAAAMQKVVDNDLKVYKQTAQSAGIQIQ